MSTVQNHPFSNGTSPEGAVSYSTLVDHLRQRAPSTHRFAGKASAAIQQTARVALAGLLKRLDGGTLEIREAGRVERFGDPGGAPISVVVDDPRAWSSVITEGSVGLGRGYIEGWWWSDQPVEFLQLIAQNLDPIEPLQRWRSRASGFLPHQILRRPTSHKDREDIAAHYDIGTDFFSLFLDETLTYSSGVFLDPDDSMFEASQQKYDRLLNKLGVTASDRILEIGTGWGGFALRAAQSRGCKVTTTTISADQYQHARRRIDAANLQDSITLLDSDWRHLSGQFDKVVSIEMIEAVDWRDYQAFFAKIQDLLTPDGAAALQVICVPGQRFPITKHREDFIKRFVFPGGGLPSLGAITEAIDGGTGLQLLDVEDITAHYAQTLRRWRHEFDANETDVAQLGYDARFRRLWRFYLAYCEAGFLERFCTANQIVLVGKGWRPGGLTVRPH